MDTNELLALAEPEIKELEFFYTNLIKERLSVVADEFSDNEKERKATEQVMDSIRAVITLDPPSVKLEYKSLNDTWLEIMNEGMPAPDVTGGIAHNPDNSTYNSKAAVTGGVYEEGAEAPSYVLDETMKIARTTMKEDIENIILNCQAIRDRIKEYVVSEIRDKLGGDAS